MTSIVQQESDKPPNYTNGAEPNQIILQEPEGHQPEQPHKWVWCCCGSKVGWTIWYSLKLILMISACVQTIGRFNGVQTHVVDLSGLSYPFLFLTMSPSVVTFFFMIAFICLMVGIHGRDQKTGLMMPMIIFQWLNFLGTSVFLILALIGSFLLGLSEKNGWSVLFWWGCLIFVVRGPPLIYLNFKLAMGLNDYRTYIVRQKWTRYAGLARV